MNEAGVHRHHPETEMSPEQNAHFFPAQPSALAVSVRHLLKHGEHPNRIAERVDTGIDQ